MLDKLILIILINLHVNIAFACSVPNQGENYDALIGVFIDDEAIDKYDEAYLITIPAYIDPKLMYGFTEADRAILENIYVYYRNKVDNTYIRSRINLSNYDNGLLRGKVAFNKEPNYEVQIVAVWDLINDWCGAVSRKMLIPNKSHKSEPPPVDSHR